MDNERRKRRYPGGEIMRHEGTVTGRIRRRQEETPILMCRTDNNGGGMSDCIACESHNMQKRCPYYEKAQYADRCSDLVFDEYCRNTRAQDRARDEYL